MKQENALEKLKLSQKAKRTLIRVVFWVLGRGFAGCARHDERVIKEVATWTEGTVISLAVWGTGPQLLLKKEKGQIRRVKKETPADLIIYFKSLEAAIRVCLGVIGVWQAYAERRFTLKGDIYFAMSVVRCMDSVEDYLFPSIMTKRILRRRPPHSVSRARIYASLLIGR